MAQVGVCRPFYAMYATSAGTVVYSNGGVLAKAVNVDIAPDNGDKNVFYADNGPAESASVFSGGTLTLDIDHLSAEVAAALLGLTVADTSTPTGGSEIVFKGDAVPPYVGFGVIFKNIFESTPEWVGVVLHKVQFQQPAMSQATQGESIEFAAPQLVASILRDDSTDNAWQSLSFFGTEANAEAWVKGKLNITG